MFLSKTEESSSDEEQENEYDGMNKLMENLAPYDYKPEWAISSSSKETESSENETSSDDATSENKNDQLGWVGNKDWCKCGQCKKGNTRNWQFMLHWGTSYNRRQIWGEEMCYFSAWIWIAVLKQNNFKKVLVGLHETLGDPLENDKDLQNISLHLAVYKQFVWWIFQHLCKGNRWVILSCVVWSIRKLFPEADGQYTRFKEGERDWLEAYTIYKT